MPLELHISLANLHNNLCFFRQITKNSAELSAVVKSNAYGLGITKIVPEMERFGVRSFFTATISEAVKVRSCSQESEIFTLNGFDFLNAKTYKEFKITPVVNNIQEAQKFIDAFGQTHKVAIQLNTGMNRLGLNRQALFENLDLIKKLPINLILSHLACADDISSDENINQRNLFNELCQVLPKVRQSFSASHGALLGTEFHFDMIRPGVGLYGGIKNSGLKSVIQIKVPILQSFIINENMQVGYNFTYKATQKMTVATLAMGYADGLPRILSNNGKLFYGNIPCPIIGRVSMDLVTVDISNLPEIPQHLCVFSPEYEVEDFAKDCKTISHEVLVNFGERINRVFSG